MNGKAVLFLILLFVSSFVAIPTPTYSLSGENVRVYVDPSSIVDPNVLFNVSINAENLVGLAGAQFRLTWDPALLRVVRMTEVMFHEVVPQPEWDNIWQITNEADNVYGIANYAYTFVTQSRAVEGGYCPIDGNHTVAILTFQVVGVGNCSLHIQLSILGTMDAEPIEHEIVDGFFSNSVTPFPIPPGPMEDSQLLFYIIPHRVKNDSLIVNSTFSIALRMDTIAAHRGIIQMVFTMQWNATLLEFEGVEESMFHEVTPTNETNNIGVYFGGSTGQLFYIVTFNDYVHAVEQGYAPIFGNHTVAIVTFKVKNVGTSLLHLTFCRAQDVLDTTILYSTSDGFFGNRINGDLNGDNLVDLFDALVFAKSFGVYPGYPAWNEEADLNGDGIIDIFDALQMGTCFRRT